MNVQEVVYSMKTLACAWFKMELLFTKELAASPKPKFSGRNLFSIQLFYKDQKLQGLTSYC